MSRYLTQNSSWFWSSLLINTCIENNVKRFFIAPGMRNAPLVAALTQNDLASGVIISWAIDERAMSYQALGYIQKSGLPAAIICTSGTALANFYPAIIEGSKSLIPLIVISADRPSELAYHDVNQSIDQRGIFGKFIREELNLWTSEQNASPKYAKSAITHALHRSLVPYPGPIHINIPLSEPLTETFEIISDSIQNFIIEEKNANKHFLQADNLIGEFPYFSQLENKIRPLLVIGQIGPLERKTLGLNQNIWELIDQLDNLHIPYLADIASGIKIPSLHFSNLSLPSFDHLETVEYFSKNFPDVVIHIGGKIISKNYERLLNEWDRQDIPLLQLGNQPFSHNPSGHFVNIDCSYKNIPTIIKSLLELKSNFNWDLKGITTHINSVSKMKSEIIKNEIWSYPAFSKCLIDSLTELCAYSSVQLFLGNSTVVRAFDCYLPEIKIAKINLLTFTQRGVSGIEGNVSSAIGMVLATNEKNEEMINFAVLGDIALFHDLNALFDLAKNKIPLITIVLNNGGGGIFTLLPISKSEKITDIITTPHDFHFEQVANNFNITYFRADDKIQFQIMLKRAIDFVKKEQGPVILESCFNFMDNKNVYSKLKTRGN